jgi:hypothetical protein
MSVQSLLSVKTTVLFVVPLYPTVGSALSLISSELVADLLQQYKTSQIK